jgi:hypothetical protein
MPAPLPLGVLPLVLVLASPPPPAPESKTCSLLTSADIEAATGEKPDGEGHPTEMQPPGSNDPMQMCTWVVRNQKGQVMISTAHMPPGTDVKALAKNNAGMDALRAQKWTEESKDFGNAWCAVMSPPASVKQPMYMSACAAAPKGTVLSVTYISPTKKLSIDQTKALTDKAAARMP